MNFLLSVVLGCFAIVVNIYLYKMYKTLTSFQIASLFYIFIFTIVPSYFLLKPEVSPSRLYYYLSGDYSYKVF